MKPLEIRCDACGNKQTIQRRDIVLGKTELRMRADFHRYGIDNVCEQCSGHLHDVVRHALEAEIERMRASR